MPRHVPVRLHSSARIKLAKLSKCSFRKSSIVYRMCAERRTKNEFVLDRITRTAEDAVRPQLRIHLVGKGKSNSVGIE